MKGKYTYTIFSATYDVWGAQSITKNNLGITRGYTTHEHWNELGLIDMNFAIKREQSEYVVTYSAMPSVSKMGEANGRVYDPQTARFLSPDPYIQAPYDLQNFNRYSYCLNNPLKYTDPSGESAIIVGAIIGAVIGTAMGAKTAHDHGHTWGDGYYWRYMMGGGAIGAVSGAASAWAGGAMGSCFSATSFASGAATGAVAGAVGGTISGAGNAWMNGGTFSDGLTAGFIQGNIGGFAGGVVGGVCGGITAYRDNRNVWTGKEIAMGRSAFSFNNTDLQYNCY